MGKTSKTLGELIGMSPICAKPLHGWCWPWSWHLIAGPTVLSNRTYLLQLIERAFLPLLSPHPPSGAEEKSAHHRVPRRSCISSISHSAFEASTSLKNFFPWEKSTQAQDSYSYSITHPDLNWDSSNGPPTANRIFKVKIIDRKQIRKIIN